MIYGYEGYLPPQRMLTVDEKNILQLILEDEESQSIEQK